MKITIELDSNAVATALSEYYGIDVDNIDVYGEAKIEFEDGQAFSILQRMATERDNNEENSNTIQKDI